MRNGNYLSTQQTCKQLGVNQKFLFRLTYFKEFPPKAQIKNGKYYLWNVELIEKYLDNLVDKQ